MRWRDRLKNLGLVLLADTLADLSGIIEEVRSAAERDRAASGWPAGQLRRRGSPPIGRADDGQVVGLRLARVGHRLGQHQSLPRG